MKKTVFLSLLVLLSISLVSVNNAAAVPFTAYTVVSDGSTIQEQDFTLNDTPWLYMQGIFVPENGLNSVGALISRDNDISVAFAVRAENTGSEVWLSLANGTDVNQDPVSWDSIKELGKWNVSAYYFAGPYGGDKDSTDFTVTGNSPVPEPMTLTLLLTGGLGALVTRKIWNRS